MAAVVAVATVVAAAATTLTGDASGFALPSPLSAGLPAASFCAASSVPVFCTMLCFTRISASILTQMSGFSRRNFLAFSRP